MEEFRIVAETTAQPGHRHRSHHHGGKRHGQSRRAETRKLVQRLAILAFLLFVALAFLYVWISSESNDTTGSGRAPIRVVMA